MLLVCVSQSGAMMGFTREFMDLSAVGLPRRPNIVIVFINFFGIGTHQRVPGRYIGCFPTHLTNGNTCSRRAQ